VIGNVALQRRRHETPRDRISEAGAGTPAGEDRSACSPPVSSASSRDYVWSPKLKPRRSGARHQSTRQRGRAGVIGFVAKRSRGERALSWSTRLSAWPASRDRLPSKAIVPSRPSSLPRSSPAAVVAVCWPSISREHGRGRASARSPADGRHSPRSERLRFASRSDCLLAVSSGAAATRPTRASRWLAVGLSLTQGIRASLQPGCHRRYSRLNARQGVRLWSLGRNRKRGSPSRRRLRATAARAGDVLPAQLDIGESCVRGAQVGAGRLATDGCWRSCGARS
jgi:hypothetical protein